MRRLNQCVSEMEDWEPMAVAADPVDQFEPEPDGVSPELLSEFSEKLSMIWEFLARGRTSETRAHRLWAALYVMRPDLIEGETIQMYAKRKGMAPSGVAAYVREFRKNFRLRTKESF